MTSLSRRTLHTGDEVDSHGWPGRIRLNLLGEFRIVDRRRGELAVAPGTAALVALAALQDGVAHDQAVRTLWPDLPPDRTTAMLSAAIWQAAHPAFSLLEAADAAVRLAPDVAVDAKESAQVAARILHDPLDAPPAEQCLTMLSADLLPGWRRPWLVQARARFRWLRAEALTALSTHCLRVGDDNRALKAGLAAVAAEPLHEGARLALQRAHRPSRRGRLALLRPLD